MSRANKISQLCKLFRVNIRSRWWPPQLLFQITSKQSPLSLKSDPCARKLRNKPDTLYWLFNWIIDYFPA